MCDCRINSKMINIGEIFKGTQEDFLGVEFCSDSLRIAYVKSSSSKKEVVSILSKDLQGLSEQETAVFISQQVQALRIRNPRVIYIMPSHMVITKNIEVPSQDSKEIEDIINLQASRHTPYGREEIIVDYINIGTYRRNYTKILLVIVNRDTVRKHFAVLRRASLEPIKASFTSEAIAKAISKVIKPDNDNSPIGLVHVDTAFSDFNVLFRDKVIFIRSIPVGIQHLKADKENQILKFVEEIKQSFEIYRNEDVYSSPTRIVIAGVVDEIKEIAALLNDSLRIPTEIISFVDYFSFSERAKNSCASSKFISYFGAVSSALSFNDIKVDLTPQETKLKRMFEKRSKEVIKTGILALSVFILVFAYVAGKIYLKNAYLEKLSDKMEEFHENALALEGDFSKIKIMRDYISRRGNSVEALSQIYDALPNSVKVLEIRFDRAGVVAIKGTAESMAEIFSLVDDLNKSSYFKEVETKYTTKRKEANKDVADFEIAATFIKDQQL